MANSNNLKCRLCLVESQCDRMHELFKKENVVATSNKRLDKAVLNQQLDFSKMSLNERVEYCCGVKLLPKPQMPTKICTKCINMIEMWYSFRQMCFNSQEFLVSQLKVAQAQDTVISNGKELQEMRIEVIQRNSIDIKDVHRIESDGDNDHDDDYEGIDCIDNDDDIADAAIEEFLHDANQARKYRRGAICRQNSDPMTSVSQKLFQCDLSEALTPEDYDEAFNYLRAENDENMEKLIDHCANKNTALRMLKRKAVGALIRERQPKKPLAAKKEIREKPMKPSIFMCNICGNVYSKKPLFQYHMRMHSEVKPYQCEICNKSYRIMSDLKNHMYRHTGERPFKCKHCDRHFMDRSSRHRHERIHTNSRPYTCNLCNKSFTYSAILKNHLKRHTGEKDYICAVCNKSFTLAHQLKAHMLTLTHRQKEAAFEAQGYKVIYEASEMTKS